MRIPRHRLSRFFEHLQHPLYLIERVGVGIFGLWRTRGTDVHHGVDAVKNPQPLRLLENSAQKRLDEPKTVRLSFFCLAIPYQLAFARRQRCGIQMTPQARSTAVAIFSSALYFGQTAGVAVGALVIDRLGATPLFLGTAVAFPALAIWFAYEIRRRQPQI